MKSNILIPAAITIALALSLHPHAEGAPEPSANGTKLEIEFKVLLIIKRESDSYSPLFLPVRSRMTDAEVANARRCFEIETPDMVNEITKGKVCFVPKVWVSEKPLRIFDPKRLDSAEYYPPELLDELYPAAKTGDFDSVGYYLPLRAKLCFGGAHRATELRRQVRSQTEFGNEGKNGLRRGQRMARRSDAIHRAFSR